MELCSGTLTTIVHFNPSPPRLSLLSSNSLPLQHPLLRANTGPSNSFKLSSFTPHTHLFQPFLCHQNRSRFTVSVSSSSSSVALGTEKDRLPADLKVTETEEPNSRVRLHVEVPPLVCEDCYKRVIAEFTKQAKVLLDYF